MTIRTGSSNQNFPQYTEAELIAEERFWKALQSWLAKAQALVTEHQTKSYPNMPENSKTRLSIDHGGKKYIRIISSTADGVGRSAYAFIEVATGNVLKPDSWKRPAKGARGNIFSENLGVGPYGALYMR